MHGDPVYRNFRWFRLSRAVRFGRELGYCEICRVSHGAIAADGRSLVFLNCAHLNGDVNDLRPENLGALCPRCHFLYDQFRRVGALARKHPALREFLAGGGRRGGKAKPSRTSGRRSRKRRTGGRGGRSGH
jgi:hypothetical protein